VRGSVSDWDAVIGEAALGLDLARVGSLSNGPGLALAQRGRPAPALTVPDTVPDDLETGGAPGSPPPLALAPRSPVLPIDPGAIFRDEALEFRARGRDLPGGVVRLGSRWLTWAYRVTLVLLAAAIASMWVIRTSESTSGPVAVDGRTGMVAALLPAAAGAGLSGSSGFTLVLPGGRELRVTGLHAVLADDAAIRNAGFQPLRQPAILVTGQLDRDAVPAGLTVQWVPLRTQATVVLRSETVADVLARQFGTMLGQGTAP
jgi:hypothetical protein